MSIDQEVMADVQARLAQIVDEGLASRNPVRFKYLEAMASRLSAHPESVQRVLAQRFEVACNDFVEKLSRAESCAVVSNTSRSAEQSSPLHDLNRYILNLMQDQESQTDAWTDAPTDGEMKSVRRFSEVWSRIAVEDHVTQALERGPENAGPLNSHMLMLRCLRLMRELSPEYLRRYVSHAEALLWLDQSNQKNALADGKSARKSKAKK